MTIRAVLFDVGGPIDTEVMHETLCDAHIVRALLSVGLSVGESAYEAANRWAIDSFAPFTYQAIIWKLCRADIERTGRALQAFQDSSPERVARRGGIELRPGIADLLDSLHQRGLKLGLAANQPARVIDELERCGVGSVFSHREVSGHHGFHKPDTRLFLRACEDLGVPPADCIMVGDRIDNDISPARQLGMRTVLFRTGRHREQQPRALHEIPHAEVFTVGELAQALDRLVAAG